MGEEQESENMWKLYMDGALGSDGFRSGLMLVSPEGKEYTYTLRFKFETTNNEADATTTKEDLVEVLHEKSIAQREVADIIKEEGENWMLPIRECLLFGTLPRDLQKARKLRIKAPQYIMMDGNLYRKSYLSLWLRCVDLYKQRASFRRYTKAHVECTQDPDQWCLRL
ncbi:hypothetical protein Tco_1067808 [Tanacetum coccineum]|uniref:Reverse transcriptase domain-containing protein n=1 Tax=Tanacetum coccineum TaxID=301880 RepID=A0ABQ5HDY3_9ASTR